MLYYAIGFFTVAILTLVLGFAGVAHGAAGIANLAFLLALGFLVAKAVSLSLVHQRRQRLVHHH